MDGCLFAARHIHGWAPGDGAGMRGADEEGRTPGSVVTGGDGAGSNCPRATAATVRTAIAETNMLRITMTTVA